VTILRPHTDLRLQFREDGLVDLQLRGSDLDTVDGLDDLVQALRLRLSVARGELTRLGHPRYGNRVHELVGEPLSRPNLELLRRHVRRTLLDDPRVAGLERLDVRPIDGEPGAVDVYALVIPEPRALLGPAFEFGVVIDVG
jgi:phage baseplate assembly protein W